MAYFNQLNLNPANLSAFGDIITSNETPVIQLDFVYGINSQLGTVTTANSATGDTNLSRLRIQSGTNAAGSAIFTTTRPAKYRQGQGVTARFTAAFTTGVASSTQIVGMGNSNDGYFFGYNGTSFGILHRNSASGSTVNTWIAQASFNGVVPAGFDPTFGNVCMIRYPFLGYGDINFYIQDNLSGQFFLVHTIRYTNTTAIMQLSNPNLSFYVQSINSGATTNQIIYIGSVGVFISGQRLFLGPTYAATNRKTGITTQTSILTLRNATTYNTITNRSLIRLKSISVAWDGANDTCLFNVIKNTTLGGSPSYTTINGTTADSGVTITNGNSVASFDVAGTTISGGIIIFNSALSRNSSAFMDVSSLDLFLEPGSILTFSILSATSGTARVSINWVEDI